MTPPTLTDRFRIIAEGGGPDLINERLKRLGEHMPDKFVYTYTVKSPVEFGYDFISDALVFPRAEVTDTKVEKVFDRWPFMEGRDFFFQDQVWIDKHGVRHPISNMSLDYIANVLKFLDEKAPFTRKVAGLAGFEDMANTPLARALSGRLFKVLDGDYSLNRPYEGD